MADSVQTWSMKEVLFMPAFKNSHLFRVTIKTKLTYKLTVTNSVLSSIALSHSDGGIWDKCVCVNHGNREKYLFGCWPTNSMFAIAFPRNASITCVLSEKSSEAMNTHDSFRFNRRTVPLDALIWYSLLLYSFIALGLAWFMRCIAQIPNFQRSRCNSAMIWNLVIAFFSLISVLVLTILGKILKLNLPSADTEQKSLAINISVV